MAALVQGPPLEWGVAFSLRFPCPVSPDVWARSRVRTPPAGAPRMPQALWATPGSAQAPLVILSWTPVRMLADRVWSSSILSYHHLAPRLCTFMVAYTPYGCLLNGDVPATVGFTPHLWQCMHDGLGVQSPGREAPTLEQRQHAAGALGLGRSS